MAYDRKKAKTEITEHLTQDAEYYPFEWIRGYKALKSQKDKGVDIWPNFEDEYASFFEDVKAECERLIAQNPKSENVPLWKEAIKSLKTVI